MAVPTIEELEAELLARVKTVDAFTEEGFSVFDAADFAAKAHGQQIPVFGVAYDGCEVVGKNGGPVDDQSPGVAMLQMQFIIVVAVQYQYAGQDDNKKAAFALLDQVRRTVLGFRGVNTRPWRFMGERPEPAASGDGVAFYSQVWQTALPIVGNFNNS